MSLGILAIITLAMIAMLLAYVLYRNASDETQVEDDLGSNDDKADR